MLKEGRKPDEILEAMYIRALSRRPSEAERKKLLPLVSEHPQDRKGYEDVLWAILNSTEFAFNH